MCDSTHECEIIIHFTSERTFFSLFFWTCATDNINSEAFDEAGFLFLCGIRLWVYKIVVEFKQVLSLQISLQKYAFYTNLLERTLMWYRLAWICEKRVGLEDLHIT